MSENTGVVHPNLSAETKEKLFKLIVDVICVTNGISLLDTLDLAIQSDLSLEDKEVSDCLNDFRDKLFSFQRVRFKMKDLLLHPVSVALHRYFREFPLRYHEEHIHLTGSLNAEFLFPRIKKFLEGPDKEIYINRINAIYGEGSLPIESPEDVDRLIRLGENDQFDRYLKILDLPKLVLIDRQAHSDAAYHLASELYHKYNIGKLRLKFTLSRQSTSESIPGIDNVTEEDVVLGLYDGFFRFQCENADFKFVLSPSFRKEPDYFDANKYKTKQESFLAQVDKLISILDRYPELNGYVCEVDTVGNERELYRKRHFQEMKTGFRKLQYRGLKLRSHHGEVWQTLNRGIQAVDNAMNIWYIDTLEHGVSLGINPNYYFHSLYQHVMRDNRLGRSVRKGTIIGFEIQEMHWGENEYIKNKLFLGTPLTDKEATLFLKAKFHTAREVEHYQHDVLNRLTAKDVSLVSLPSSNSKLTGFFPDYRDHPFSWWEKKGVKLGVGTDNYITLNTDFIREMLILLYSDPRDLKITKLLMVTSGEERRPFLSQLMWDVRKKFTG